MSLYFDEIKNCNFAKRFSLKNPKFVGTSCNMFLDVLDCILRMKEVFSFYFSGGMFAPKTILLEFDEMKPKQRKKNVKTGEGEPQIKVTEEVEGRVSGPAKTLMDANVYDVMAKEEVPPPPPYTSNSGGKTRTSASFRLTGQT